MYRRGNTKDLFSYSTCTNWPTVTFKRISVLFVYLIGLMFGTAFNSSHAVSSIDTVTVFNKLYSQSNPLSIIATPINIQFYSRAAPSVPCDSVLSLAPGNSYTSSLTNCSPLYQFIVTALASPTSGTTFPYNTNPVKITLATSGTSSPVYLVFDSGAGTPPTGSGASCTTGTPTNTPLAGGLFDTSVPPLLDAPGTGVVCSGALAIALLPSIM